MNINIRNVLGIAILLDTQIPPILHYNNPRTHLGKTNWTKVSKKVQEIANKHCMACNDFVPHVPGNYIECHELYTYKDNRMLLYGVVGICTKCHNYIHNGRLNMLYREGKITQEYQNSIIERGNKLLGFDYKKSGEQKILDGIIYNGIEIVFGLTSNSIKTCDFTTAEHWIFDWEAQDKIPRFI